MNEEQIGRREPIVVTPDDGAAIEASREHELGNRIDALMSLTHRALQRDNNSTLSQYLASTMADIARARFLLGAHGDTSSLEHMVDTVTDKITNIDAQIADYQKMIDALTTDGKTTSSQDALFYHEQIRKLEAMQEELIQLSKV